MKLEGSIDALHFCNKLFEVFFIIEFSMTSYIWTTDVKHKIIYIRMQCLEASCVILRVLIWGSCCIFSNISTNYKFFLIPFKLFDYSLQSCVIKAHSIDKTIVLFEPKETLFGITILGFWRNCSYFYKSTLNMPRNKLGTNGTLEINLIKSKVK